MIFRLTRFGTSGSSIARPQGTPNTVKRPESKQRRGHSAKVLVTRLVMAVSAKMAAAKFNTKEHTIFDQHVVALAGDGCLQEGVSAEAAAFAGHTGLDNLIIIYDSNDVTLDAMADVTQSEDTAKRFESYGFDVQNIDGHDLAAIAKGF